ncbi:hypothetical protein BGZ76_010595 [Entomortierella beljakovae]|nr:hypothetical protein BGZ76_010595 [Entomortierella beljakovae]
MPSLQYLLPFPRDPIRTLDQHNRDPSTPSDTDNEKSLEDTIETHIQPQHTNPMPPNTDPKARMLIGFTCTVCNHRSHKTMSKHSYNHGVVIMQCDSCKNRHLIADHLGWFKNGGVTVEDLVKEKGETVQKLTRDYHLVKDGELTSSSSGSNIADSINPEAGTSPKEDTQKPKTELELALEKAAMGTLEWIPKDILQQEEERMRKSQEAEANSKKQ